MTSANAYSHTSIPNTLPHIINNKSYTSIPSSPFYQQVISNNQSINPIHLNSLFLHLTSSYE